MLGTPFDFSRKMKKKNILLIAICSSSTNIQINFVTKKIIFGLFIVFTFSPKNCQVYLRGQVRIYGNINNCNGVSARVPDAVENYIITPEMFCLHFRFYYFLFDILLYVG